MFPYFSEIPPSSKYPPEQTAALQGLKKTCLDWMKFAHDKLNLDDNPFPRFCQEQRAECLAIMLFPNLEAELREDLARLIYLGSLIYIKSTWMTLDDEGFLKSRNYATADLCLMRLGDKAETDKQIQEAEVEFVKLKQELQSDRMLSDQFDLQLTPIQKILLDDFILNPLST